MSDKKDDLEEKEEKSNEENKKVKASKILDAFLALIILITVVTGSIIYYKLYTYSKENDSKNQESEVAQEESKTVADLIDTALNSNTVNNTENQYTPNGNTTVSSGDIDDRLVLNENIIVLYNGLILENDKMGVTSLKYIDNSNPSKDNYVVTYYNYENYSFKDSSLGTLSSQVVEGLVKIDNVGKVSISEKYDAIPREIQVINSIPAVILDNNSNLSEYDSKKTIITDLDGNGTNEYILILGNKNTGESKVLLVESTGFIKATIAKMDKSGWDGVSSDGYYLSYNNVEILDIDNDGIMEILFEIPNTSSTNSQISLVKYKNGDVTGELDYTCSLKK